MKKQKCGIILAVIMILACFMTSCQNIPGEQDRDGNDDIVVTPKPSDETETPFAGDLDELILYPAPREYVADSEKTVELQGKMSVDANLEVHALNKTKKVLHCYFDVSETAEGKADILIRQDKSLPESGYRLGIDKNGIHIDYRDGAGAYYAAVTLNQLFDQLGNVLPYLSILDYPDLEMRGFLLDMARDRVPTVETLKSLIDDMAAMKMNYLMLFVDFPSTIQCDLLKDIQRGDRGLTIEECKEVTAYAEENYIDIIPFVESLGHMENLLQYPKFVDLRETFTQTCTTICVQNPESQKLISGLFDVVIECFDPEYILIGADESYEIGTGQSLTYLPGASVADVYLDSIKKIYDIVDAKGKKSLICHDMLEKFYVSSRIKIRETFGQMPEAKVVYWSYEEDATFANTAFFDKLGIDYIIMPSTNSFGSAAGRLSTAEKNLNTGVKIAVDKQKMGVMTATFGDGGHRNPLISEYNPLAYSAGLCWNYSGNVNKTDLYEAYVGRYIFGETEGNVLVKAWDLLQRYNDVTGRSWGQSLLVAIGNEPYMTFNQYNTYIGMQPGEGAEKYENFLLKMDEVILRAETLKDTLSKVTLDNNREDVIKAEMKVSADMIILLAEYAKMRVQLHEGLKTEQELQDKAAQMYAFGLELLDEYRATWLLGNKFALLEDSVYWLSIPLYLFGNVGKVFDLPTDGNLFLLTPDRLEFLDEELFSRSYIWNSYGKAYPTISLANGVFTYSDIPAMFEDGSLRLYDRMDGVKGKVYAMDRDAMMENYHYTYYYGDVTKQSLLTCVSMWPGIFDGKGVYEITAKVKYESGRQVEGNVAISGQASLNGIVTLTGAAIEFSSPDQNGWVTVTYTYSNVSDYKYMNFGVNPLNELEEDILYIAELSMKKIGGVA